MTFTTPLRRFATTALALSLLAGCGDDNDGKTPDNGGDSTTPVYAIAAQSSGSGSSSQTYIILTDKVEQTEQLSFDNAVVIPGRALIAGLSKKGALFVGGSEGPTVTRYNLTADGKLEKGETVSFAPKAVKTIGEYQNAFQFVSDTKAYYFDGSTQQAIVWNPSDMSLTGSIPLNGLTVDGAGLSFSSFPIRRGNQLVMLPAWRTSTAQVVKQAGVVVIDTTTDTATVVKDDRCGYARDGVIGPDGLLYMATEAYGAAYRRTTGESAPESCMIRFDLQKLAFDSSFYVSLNTLAGGQTVGSLVPGPNGAAYLRVLDESTLASPVTAGTSARALASAAAWRWSRFNFDARTATPVAGFPATSGSAFVFEAGNQTLFTSFKDGNTTLHLMTGEDGKLMATSTGMAFSFLQVR
ncbi:MxcI protein [Vitiosangium sp. GDMCC 1.1324]|uniref:MxcI protein n=1 Tax=Vitiosangium sp. (strain GDMCC 1.1324) TaxID=2138576 RepID=UPI000D3C5D01|nr:MxcI protein [Vitiosangium sp. GDMCC 1.1324]PTL85186.1 MxcI protein [Vitiosangium sp. GDMCC 1.1324]